MILLLIRMATFCRWAAMVLASLIICSCERAHLLWRLFPVVLMAHSMMTHSRFLQGFRTSSLDSSCPLSVPCCAPEVKQSLETLTVSLHAVSHIYSFVTSNVTDSASCCIHSPVSYSALSCDAYGLLPIGLCSRSGTKAKSNMCTI